MRLLRLLARRNSARHHFDAAQAGEIRVTTQLAALGGRLQRRLPTLSSLEPALRIEVKEEVRSSPRPQANRAAPQPPRCRHSNGSKKYETR